MVLNNQILDSFLKLGQNSRMTSEKIHFSQTSYENFVLAINMKPKFDYLTPQVIPKFSIFSKCDMLGHSISNQLTQNLIVDTEKKSSKIINIWVQQLQK